MNCPKCTTNLKPSAQFCTDCGTKIVETTAPVNTPEGCVTIQCQACGHDYSAKEGQFKPCPKCDGGTASDSHATFDGRIVDRLQLAAYFIVGIGAVSAIVTFFSLNAASADVLGFLFAVLVAAFVVVVGLVAAVTYFALAEIVRRLQSIDFYVQAIRSENEGEAHGG
ncbi:MAG: zinc ribbon domain-containing protein [Coriobacteriia bacterium]|nr:zinc ribbon domain-containing protein [Coriobacteriia bacterium]MCL2606475.1 zinc ribbon domain-containing protein [Coriobacteriia bacterium]